jgi:hypothetical protein
METSYETFLNRKSQMADGDGFAPTFIPPMAFGFQEHLINWSCERGRAAIFADCGLGKSLCELTWAENVHRKTNRPVLLLTPLAVANQMQREAAKFGIEAAVSASGPAPGVGITVTNYEKLQHFDPDDFAGVVCDESSILKSFSGQRRKQITRAMCKMRYRLLATATAAPNDYVELGTSSEALGELSHSDMLKRFFKQLDDKGQKKETRDQLQAEKIIEDDANYFQKLSYRVAQTIGQWRLKHHGVDNFWRWVASWSVACRMPSDLGYSDDGFILPPLTENDHVIAALTPPPGCLFNMPAIGLGEERDERRRTLDQRCRYVADLVNHDRSAVVWCHMNAEGDLLEKLIPGSRQVAGRHSDEHKIEAYDDFESGKLRVLICKPKIGAWGLNWQHCNHVVTFASHSFEQHYQSIRRCWRFGQGSPVTVDTVCTEGEIRVLQNMRRKAEKAETMFTALVAQMNNSTTIKRENLYTNEIEVPQWL